MKRKRRKKKKSLALLTQAAGKVNNKPIGVQGDS